MDFSKIKKIFYIIAIISMLLSIKSKVLGASSITIDDPIEYTFNLDSKFDDFTYIYIFYNPDFTYNTNPIEHASSFYFCASKSPITFRQEMHNFGGVPYLTSYINTQDNSSLYAYSTNLPYNNDFITNIIRFNNLVNSNATLRDSNSFGFTFENPNVTTNIQFNNIVGLYISTNVEFENGDIAIPSTVFDFPQFDNVAEIENGNPDGVFISPGDFTNTDDLYFHLLEINTGLSNSDSSIYYYSDKTFNLNKDSDYFSTWYDPSIEGFYYYIPRYKLGLSQDTSYLYVLNNSKTQINNSYGLYAIDTANGIYDVVQSDTAGVITATEEETDRMKNIEQSLINNQETTNNINDSLTNTTINEDTQTDINSSLDFNNQNESLNNLNGGFFSRLTSMLSNLLGYNLSEDTSVNLPLPNSNKSITLHSKDIYDNVTGAIRLIINAFWVYIFSYYMWKFINKIYIAVSTGNILDSFSSSDEAITNNML